MLKTLLIILCAYWAWRLFKRLTMPLPRTTTTNNTTPQITTELVKDPVCETYIDKTTAVTRDGRYFCSESCAAKFKDVKERAA